MAGLTKEQLIEAVKQALGEDGYITDSEFQRRSGINRDYIYRLFPEGGWFEVLTLAGANPEKFAKKHVSDEELIREYHRIVKKLGRIPSWNLLAVGYPYSVDLLRKRFKGLEGVLNRYREWLEVNEPDSPTLTVLRDQIGSSGGAPTKGEKSAQVSIPIWPKVHATEFGEPISFRGLRHAPINEQGVVFLFGMLARELRFEVEAVHASYPDCEAKRLVDPRRKSWQRVTIEFEFQSQNFLEHGHDPKQCDLIVCWEHNWVGCPVEVLELRKIVIDTAKS